jgi:hypothetical protein
LLARVAAGRRVDEAGTVSALCSGQRAIDRGVQSLHLGRGNVVADLVDSEDQSYFAVQLQRDGVEFLLGSMGRDSPAGEDASEMRLQMARLRKCWPKDFTDRLQQLFPTEDAARLAKNYLARVLAARHFGAGNCGEHARVVADERARLIDRPTEIRIARSAFMDHAWAEARAQDGALRDDDVIMDGWMRTVAHLREDSHCGSVANDTRGQLNEEQARWLAGTVRYVQPQLDRMDSLRELTLPAAKVLRENCKDKDILADAEGSVPINLRADFLDEARRRTEAWPVQSLLIEATGVARSLGKPIAAATHVEALGAITASFDLLLQQPAHPPWPPVVRPATDAAAIAPSIHSAPAELP